jgi:hypothetical protein
MQTQQQGGFGTGESGSMVGEQRNRTGGTMCNGEGSRDKSVSSISVLFSAFNHPDQA